MECEYDDDVTDSHSKEKTSGATSRLPSSSAGARNCWEFTDKTLRGSANNENYCMDYPHRGRCYIFNNRVFNDPELNERKGTVHDVIALYHIFEDLKFDKDDIHCFNDLTESEILNELKKAASEDYKEYSCFVCIVLTHGYCGLLHARDKQYEAEKIFRPFRGDACRSLAGKPKLFFIQACEGDRKKDGKAQDTTDCGNAGKRPIKIPTHADFLIAHCRVPGFYAWENEDRGSWFIQTLCEIIKENSNEKDLLQMLTMVNRKVAERFEDNSPEITRKRQVPYITSTLTKNVFFPVKNH